MLAGVMTGCHLIVVDRWGPESIDLLAREGCTLPGSGQVFFLAFLEAQRKLPAGERARIERERGNYFYVRAAGERAGWVDKRDFGKIWP